MKNHKEVKHPSELIIKSEKKLLIWQDKILDTLASQAGSRVAFWACFIIPLLALPASITVKLIVSIIFSNWYQAWALPAIQRKQEKGQKLAEAKANTDHQALTHIANKVDEILLKIK